MKFFDRAIQIHKLQRILYTRDFPLIKRILILFATIGISLLIASKFVYLLDKWRGNDVNALPSKWIDIFILCLLMFELYYSFYVGRWMKSLSPIFYRIFPLSSKSITLLMIFICIIELRWIFYGILLIVTLFWFVLQNNLYMAFLSIFLFCAIYGCLSLFYLLGLHIVRKLSKIFNEQTISITITWIPILFLIFDNDLHIFHSAITLPYLASLYQCLLSLLSSDVNGVVFGLFNLCLLSFITLLINIVFIRFRIVEEKL
jgi:hypothetical protein